LEILSNYNSNVISNEFEFEIDVLDIETLWELDWLVTNWKKSRNKKPRIVTYRSGTLLESTTKRLRSKLEKDSKYSKAGDEGEVVNERLEKDLKNSKGVKVRIAVRVAVLGVVAVVGVLAGVAVVVPILTVILILTLQRVI
jgi:NADPH-dependent 7-cyano-7-deazaguanine reductase QueF-like protein